MSQKCSIVIPIYKNTISGKEIASLKQSLMVLGNYQIMFIAPNSLDTGFYEQFCASYNVEFKIERFDDTFFESLNDYSRLLLNVDFYKRFESFDYILICQLDVWIFKNDLNTWLEKDYDYIGAPWFEKFGAADENSKLLSFAGNGGLSLRKISSFIKVLSGKNLVNFIMNWDDIFYFNKKNRFLSNILNIPKFIWLRYRPQNLGYFFFKLGCFQEDYVFAKFIPRLNKDFKVAPPKEAMYFAFEAKPSTVYEMTNNTLPFGCHAREKYEPKFWEKFIPQN